MLKIVVSKPGAFASTDFTQYKDLIYQAQEEGHFLTYLEYLHGEVEREMGYDIGLLLNAEEVVNESKDGYKPGVYDAQVVDYPKPCKAYLWDRLALVVDAANVEDNEYAQEKYEEKATSL